jgi:hypothetical protein
MGGVSHISIDDDGDEKPLETKGLIWPEVNFPLIYYASE